MTRTIRHATLTLVASTAMLALAAAADAATVGYWRFEDSPGFLADSGPNGLDLTNSGTVLHTTPPINTDDGSFFPNPVPQTGLANAKAAEWETPVDGGGGSLSRADSVEFELQTFTVEAYLNMEDAGSGSFPRVIAGQWDNASQSSWALLVTGLGSGLGARNLILQVSGNGSSTETIDSNIALTLGTDYFIAVRFDAADTTTAGASFYVKNLQTGNEVSVGLGHTATSLHNSTVDFMIGNRVGTVRGWDGLISELRISDTLLADNKLLNSVFVPTPAALPAGLALLAIAGLRRRRRD